MKKFLEALDRGVAGWLLKVAIRGYRLSIGVVFRGACRFEPSCSHYSEQAIEKYGALKGSYLTLGRLMRCHPFRRGGVDPVP